MRVTIKKPAKHDKTLGLLVLLIRLWSIDVGHRATALGQQTAFYLGNMTMSMQPFQLKIRPKQ